MINEEKKKIQEEALSALESNGYNGIVILPTGTGKSYILIESLKALYKAGMKVLYTCDSIRLRDTDFCDELKKWGAEAYIPIVERQCYASAYKMDGEYYDILLADEGDYALTPEYSKLFFNNKFKHIIFVSATLQKDKSPIAKQIAPVVYQKKVKEVEESGVVNKSHFFYVPYMLNSEENKKYLMYNERFKKLLWERRTPEVQKKLEFLTFERLHFLADLKSSAYICRKLLNSFDKNARSLVFCGHTEQADKIGYSYHTKNADEDNLNKFNDGLINECCICGKVDRGVNLNGVNHIIVESATASETKMIQKLGRGKRLKIHDVLKVYFLVPHYVDKWGKNQPTVVLKKIQHSCKNLGIENATTIILK